MELLDGFSYFETKDTKKKGGPNSSGLITLICSKRNGKRIILSKELEDILGLTDTVNIAVSDEKLSLLFYKVENPTCNTYSLCRQKKDDVSSRLIVYNSALVEEIAKKLNLDFSDKVSITFYKKKVLDECDNTFVIITE